VLGAVLLAITLVVVIPVGVSLVGAAMAAVLGTALKDDGEERSAGSELVDLNT
jgi:hypothetical protein